MRFGILPKVGWNASRRKQFRLLHSTTIMYYLHGSRLQRLEIREQHAVTARIDLARRLLPSIDLLVQEVIIEAVSDTWLRGYDTTFSKSLYLPGTSAWRVTSTSVNSTFPRFEVVYEIEPPWVIVDNIVFD